MKRVSDPDDFEPLSDSELAALAPELGFRAGLLVGIVESGMVRQPQNDSERSLAVQLAALFPEHYRLAD